MSWTDDRVAMLSKLWAEGLSASQIAEKLGGVTRNAVIGKVHRLKLGGRAKPAGKSSSAPRRKAAPRTSASSSSRSSARSYTTRTSGNAALKVEMEEDVFIAEKPAEDVVVPISRKLTLMQLTETTCKWPTGDPTLPGFSFCGQTTKEDQPYCEFHCNLAFQPASERRRRR